MNDLKRIIPEIEGEFERYIYNESQRHKSMKNTKFEVRKKR